METHKRNIIREKHTIFLGLRQSNKRALFDDEEEVKKRINTLTKKLTHVKDKTRKLTFVKELTKLQSLYFDILRNKNKVTQKEFLETAEHLSKKMQSGVI
jgi:hypothetical protein